MKKIIDIGNENLTIIIPDGFHEMTDDECISVGGSVEKNNLGLRNENIHFIYNMVWKKVPFIGKLVGLSQVVENTEKSFRKQLQDFAIIKKVDTVISNKQAQGFRYKYIKEGVSCTAEYLLLKTDKNYCAFICIGRTENFNEKYYIFDDMLKSATIN